LECFRHWVDGSNLHRRTKRKILCISLSLAGVNWFESITACFRRMVARIFAHRGITRIEKGSDAQVQPGSQSSLP